LWYNVSILKKRSSTENTKTLLKLQNTTLVPRRGFAPFGAK
jgi:hypothetical protein